MPCTICPFLQIIYFVFVIVPAYMCTCVSAYSFSCGSTWHAAGLMAIPLGGNTLMTKYRHDTIKLIPELEKDSGCDTGV